MSINRVILSGNLARDPDVRFTPQGKAVCEATICVSEKWKTESGDERERTAFVGLIIWGARGEAFAKFHKKGNKALIEGKLVQETWDDKESGKKREKTKVQVDQWEFFNGKAPEGYPAPQRPQQPKDPTPKADAKPTEEDDVPF